MKTLLILGMLTVAPAAFAQDRIATTFYLGGAVSDIGTTWRNMQSGHQETDPVYHFTRDQPIGTALSLAATDVLTLWLAHRYSPTHPKLVKVALYTLGSIRYGQAARNARAWYLDTHRPFDLGSH